MNESERNIDGWVDTEMAREIDGDSQRGREVDRGTQRDREVPMERLVTTYIDRQVPTIASYI